MKIVKYVFLLLLLAVIAVTVFIATQEGKYDIKKERVINVPKAVLYNYINDYKNWENVGILTNSDTTAVYTFSEKTSGKGAQMSWKKDDSTGKIETVKLDENDSIMQNAVINDLDSEISWTFKDTLKSTKVTLRLKGNLTFLEKANALLKGGSNEQMESSLEKGLTNIDNFLVKELSIFNIDVKDELVTKTGSFYLGHLVTSKIEEINKKAGEYFPKLQNFIKTNKIATNGSPFILYKSFDKAQGNATYLICIPIKEEIFTAPGSEFEGGNLLPFTALKTTLKGDYSHLKKAWTKAEKHIIEKALQENTTGQYVEVYSKGITKTKKPSEWVTDIYIPIGAPTIVPAIEGVTNPALPTPAITNVKPAGGIVKPITGTTGSKPATGAVRSTVPSMKPASAANRPTTGTTKPTATTTKPAIAKPTTTPASKPATQSTNTPR